MTGTAPGRCHARVPAHERVRYRQLYPGIDLDFYTDRGRPEYDFRLAPGADPEDLRIRFDGASDLSVDADGDLVLATAGGAVELRAPKLYQEIGGRAAGRFGALRAARSPRGRLRGRCLRSAAPALAVPGAGAWWSALEFDAAPKIIARLPFVERADHPAAMPVFVLSRVAADAMATEAAVWSVRVAGWGAKAAEALSMLADFIAVPDRAFDGAAMLVTLPQEVRLDTVSQALVKAGATLRSSALVGSHATRYTVAAKQA